jgi:hypothetical protein
MTLAPLFPTVSTWWKRPGPGHALQGQEHCLVLNNVRNNENFHHAAYKQYVLWHHEKIRKWEQENDSKLLRYSNTETIHC